MSSSRLYYLASGIIHSATGEIARNEAIEKAFRYVAGNGVISGGEGATTTGTLTVPITAGEALLDGWINWGASSLVLPPNSVSYVFVQIASRSNGAHALAEFVYGASATPPNVNSVLLFKATTDGTEVTAVDNVPEGRKVITALTSGIPLGSGADGTLVGGLNARYQIVADTGSADTEFAVAHGLGRTPIGYLVCKIDKACVVYTGTTGWTDTNIYLKCNANNAAITVIVF